MKKTILILMLFITSIAIGQAKLEEATVDANGKVITKTTVQKSTNRSPEKTIEMFYDNQDDVKALDPLMSFRFYQKTPYYKLNEILKQKNESCGKFVEKTLIKTKTSEDKNSIAYLYDVTYKNMKTTEEIVLIRESTADNFQVYIYNIKKQ